MKEYVFIPIKFRDEGEFWKENARRLQVLLDNCELITTNYGVMYERGAILSIGDSFRGPTIEFGREEGMTYYYNVAGGYTSREYREVESVINDIAWPILTEEEKEVCRNTPRVPLDLSAGYSALGKLVDKINKAK